MVGKERNVETLQNRVAELERQLAETQAAIRELTSAGRDELPANDAQQRAEELHAIIQTLHDPVMVYDQNGVIYLANASARRAHGFDPTGRHRRDTNQTLMVRYPSGEYLQSDDLPSARALKGETVIDEALIIKNSRGQELNILVTSSPLIVNGVQKGAVSIWHDITEQKRVEEALRTSEAKYRSLVETAFEGIWVVDTNGHTLFVNRRMAEMLKYASPGELMERSAFDFVPLEDIEEVKAKFRVRLDGTSPEQYDVRLQCRDGSVIWTSAASNNVLDENGNVIGRMALFMDITKRKQAEEGLRQSEEKFSRVFQSNPAGMTITRVADSHYTEVNESFCQIIGYTREEIIEHTSLELGLFTEVEREEALRQFQKQGKIHNQEFSVITKSGTTRHVLFSLDPIDVAGEPSVLATLIDITKRKQAEEALRKSEERFAKAFHASPDAIIISRLADGLIIEVNEGWTKIFEHPLSEAVGQTTLALGVYADPDDREKMIDRLKAYGLLRDYEIQMRGRSGEIRQASMSAEQIEINGEDCLLAIIRDITEQKRAEEALRASERRLRAFFESDMVGMIFWNIDGQITDANAKFLRMIGYSREELVAGQLKWSELTPSEYRDADQYAIQELKLTGVDTPYEKEFIRKDGARVPIIIGASMLDDERYEGVAFVLDITERRQVEQELRESERRFRSLANSMPQLVWTALPDGSVDYYNQRYQEYWGIKSAIGAVWEWSPVLHGDDLQPTLDAWRRSVETGETYQIEHRVRMADDSYRWHLSRGVPMLDDKGQVIRWFGTATDIHDMKVAQEQLQVYAQRLEHSNRELEQFAFIASHDLQEPLRKIEVFGDLLLESSKSLSGRERNYLDRMRDAAGRMRDMVDGLLQLSRIMTQGKPFIQVELSQVTADVLSVLETQIRRTGGRVDVEMLPAIEGDPLQLRQLIQNLIGNALKYHQPDVPPEVKIYAKQAFGAVQIFVEDHGIGFDQEDAERVFQPFQRLVGRSQYEGSGIGLAICRRIVERHRGEIAVHSQPGQGTTFVVTLPVYHPQASARNEAGKDSNHGDSGITFGR